MTRARDCATGPWFPGRRARRDDKGDRSPSGFLEGRVSLSFYLSADLTDATAYPYPPLRIFHHPGYHLSPAHLSRPSIIIASHRIVVQP